MTPIAFTIRDEHPDDIETIHALTETAFAQQPHSKGREGPILQALRADGDLSLSLVAISEGQLIGHAAFSPVTLGAAEGHWYALGPISVAPARQRQGIGSALVQAGLERLRAIAADGCVLIGAPEVYGPMGFVGDGRITYHGLDKRYVQHLAFGNRLPQGELTYAPAFQQPGPS